jgi:hypothetical protein
MIVDADNDGATATPPLARRENADGFDMDMKSEVEGRGARWRLVRAGREVLI